MSAAVASFTALPADREAHEPPEARGVARDRVALMVAARTTGAIGHHPFDALPDLLAPGDLLVVNTSATLPAALDAADAPLQVRFSTRAPHLPGGWHVVEVRTRGGLSPVAPGTVAAGQPLELAGGVTVTLAAPYATSARLWLARVTLPDGAAMSLNAHLRAHGQPIRYAYVPRAWPLADYQTAFAIADDAGGSAEMPSAARPFTPALIARLVARGIRFAPLALDTGVSSPERHEAPYAEAYNIPETTARLVNLTRGDGRVIAVGTTAVRALETTADPDGTVRAGAGWTDLVISPDRPVRAVDGLITGWHEPEASHLDLLREVAGADLLDASYAAAVAHGYLWHEFGDSHLILP